ncbi:EF-hand domain-containing protein [Adhaeretor mobilis]|uniref:EF hand n=1 Tax=Adhaeretor mobilis TaxID=1930276 RepID=A0A517MTN4_9BACT|nr:EF-hand domain-containing protein [Adhaeretor mobilis]QDS98245.1 EF hand [Adhaeretor mobilis]
MSPTRPCGWCYAVLAPLSLVLAGCGGPETLSLPSYSPSGSAAKAMELYDTNSDGFVGSEELENAPGLRAALRNLDQDKDGKVSEEEVAERAQSWEDMRIGIMRFNATFLLDGKPLGNADIVFEPEEFMLDAVQPTAGQTDLGGYITPRVPKEKRPTPDTPPGMQAGIYKIRVSKVEAGKETIPARYNTDTVLGQEVSSDDYAIVNKKVIFKLKSK